jgi:hypothetical protein
MKIVEVQWVDAQSSDEWQTVAHATADELPIITTVGYLLRHDKTTISVAMQLDTKNDKTSMVMTIPSSWIKKLRTLRR